MYIKPQNFPQETEDFIKFMNLDPDLVISEMIPTSEGNNTELE